MNAPTNWDDLRVLLALARAGSQGGAARTLRVDPTTVGRRLAALEGALGARLVQRLEGGLALTTEGQTLLAHAERVEAEVLSAERVLSGSAGALEGPVRLTSSDALLNYLVLPSLGALRRAHPGITLELRADLRVLDLSRREADVAIRLGRPREGSLVASRVGTLRSGLYASGDYLHRHGTPRSPAELGAHHFVGLEASLDGLQSARWLRTLVPAPSWSVRASTATGQVLACAEGAGLAVLGCYLERREPRLVRVLASRAPPAKEVWLAVHADLKHTPRVAAVRAWLQQALGELS